MVGFYAVTDALRIARARRPGTALKAVGLGESGSAALQSVRCEAGGAIAFPEDGEGLRRAIADAGCLLISTDAGDRDCVESACLLAETAKADGVLVWIAALPPSADPGSAEALCRLERSGDALLLVSNALRRAEDGVNALAALLDKLFQCLEIFRADREMTVPVDFEDLKTLFSDAGKMFIGIGSDEGKWRTTLAALGALGGGMVEPPRAKFSRALVCFESNKTVGLTEMQKALALINEACEEDALILWGHAVNYSMGDGFKVIMFAA